MRYTLFLILTMLSLDAAIAQFPTGFAGISVVSNLDPTAMTLAPNGDIFLAEKNGRVIIIRNGQMLPQPFIELAVDNYNERGLSGIAVHPDYPATPFIYLYYTVPGANHNRLVRVQAVNDQALPGNIETLLEIDQMPGTIHNGGAMFFGLDGMLYVAVGDGAGFDVAQSLQSLLGKVLRIQPDGVIPADNPFYQQTTGKYRAIWATGLRNPFTFTIQPGIGRMAVGDVGSDQFEEINLIEAGKNYGWPLVEGFWQGGGNPPANYEDPLHAYNHNVGCCVAGAAFYNPATAQFPANYNGQLFFGEYCQGKIWHINPATGGAVTEFATGLDRPLCLLTHPDGSLYCITRGGLGGGSEVDNTSSNEGVLWRILYNPSGAPLVATQPDDVLLSVGETARFYVTAAGNAPFSYQWRRNGSDITDATADSLILQNVALSDSGAVFSCLITNGGGTILSNAALLRVTSNQPPVANIELPLFGATYAAGQTLFFKGSGVDPETGPLPAQNLAWRIDFHHNIHTHPFLPYTTGLTEGSILIPQVGETAHDVWYRVYLYVSDGAGLNRQVWRDVFPQKSVLTFQTQPEGLPLFLDGQPISTPAIDTSVVGILRNIAAPGFAAANGQAYLFDGWSDGEQLNGRQVETPTQNLTLTANYQTLQVGMGTGLLGLYFNNDNGNFTQPVTAWRIDPQLDFYWGGGSPFEPSIGADNFAVRWLGDLEPWQTGNYFFYLTGDDGVRLHVNDSLLIDSWMPSNGDTRTGGPIYLEAGERYPLRVELFEIGGEAEIKLEWGFEGNGRATIPTSQLYPAPSFTAIQTASSLGDLRCRIIPNPFKETGDLEVFAPSRTKVNMEVYDMAGRTLNRHEWYADPGFNNQDLRLGQAPSGMYLVKIMTAKGSLVLKVEKI
ncbi:MAG: PQQ-dependent sugar dehydrogenase [Saprospiraceae bacterium]